MTSRQGFREMANLENLTYCFPRKVVADALRQYAEESGVDGFNLAYAISPGSFEDFVRFVVPELRERGVIRVPSNRSLTLRERFQRQGNRELQADHPGTAYRVLKNRLPGAPRPTGLETLRTTLNSLDSGRWLFGG